MAITISSLTPANPIVVTSGDTVNFSVIASDSGGASLSYQWQISFDAGATYSASGLTTNTNTFFNFGPLDSGSSGVYVRVVITNGVDTIYSDLEAGIGIRTVTVTASPIIVAFVETTVDDYPVSETIGVGDTFNFTATASLQNVDVTTTTNVNNIGIVWQESTDDGSSWSNIISTGDYGISASTELFPGPNTAYYRKSTLTISNSGYSRNLNQYRAVFTYTGASNSPVNGAPIVLYVEPVISIFKQPGQDATDTKTLQCYKTGISGSGELKVSVGAFSTSGLDLSYYWEINVNDEDGYPNDNWVAANSVLGATTVYSFRLKPGTNHTSPTLQLERFIFYNVIAVRCLIFGSADEDPVYTTTHYIYPYDVQILPTLPSSIDAIEDRYGDIVNRDIYPEPIQNAIILGGIDEARNIGQNGDVLLTMQRKDPGTTTWYDIEVGVESATDDILIVYTQFPSNTSEITEFKHETFPLRVDTDNGAKYRLKATSSAVWSGTASGGTDVGGKTLTPFYSNETTLNVYRTIYIDNQPSNVTAFANKSAAFSVSATPSSGFSSEITYQWQYSTSGTPGTYVDITNGGVYTGATTSLLQISTVSLNPTYSYYRCVCSISGQLASTTTTAVRLFVKEDLFNSITNLNDITVDEFSVVSWDVVATTLSASVPTYQWQYSVNFDPNNALVSSWSDIAGQTSSTFTIASAALTDAGFYRCKVTSAGGTVQYTNAAKLTVSALIITILKDIQTTYEVVEGQTGVITFECEGLSSNSGVISYQWEYLLPGGSWTAAGNGHLSSDDNTRFYTPDAFDRSEDGIKLRCKLTADGIPSPQYTSQCTITVNRRLTYVKSPNTLIVTIGSTMVIDINPSWTGDTPSFQWQDGGVDISGATSSQLVIPNIDSSYNGKVYRCKITLADCNQYAYTENNAVVIQSVSSIDYTKNITISTTVSSSKPSFYSKETEKSGAAIGTVICIPKPAGYVNNPAATTDDRNKWGMGHHGKGFNGGNVTSATTSGPVYTANKPAWVSNPNYKAAKSLDENNRFKGFVELRGQLCLAQEFPELARMFGTTYGGTITGTYPTYNVNDTFRLPLTYAKKLLGTGNVSGNKGSVSIIPEYNPNDTSGGDKNLPGSQGGVYNYIKSAQLPPGSSGISGDLDGTADGAINAETYTIGTFSTNGWGDVQGFPQPTFSGSVTYTLPSAQDRSTANPTHAHSAVSVGATAGYQAIKGGCNGYDSCLNTCSFPGSFRPTDAGSGEITDGPWGLSDSRAGKVHTHPTTGTVGTFDMVKDAGMIISDTTITMNLQSKQLFDNATSFYLRNNSAIPVNAPYFRLRYMIKAY